MVNTRKNLADTRAPQTVEDAEKAVQRLAEVETRLAVQEAALEREINFLKSEHATATEADRNLKELLETRVLRFIESNLDKFQKPKSITTDFGVFGRRQSTRTEIADQDQALAYLKETHPEAVETVEKILVPVVTALLKNGVEVPTAEQTVGDVYFVKIHKHLLAQARDLDLEEVAL